MPTLLFGIFYNVYQKGNGKHMLLGLLCISFIKNSITFFILGGILDISIYTEGKEIYQAIIQVIPS
jgi:hypothetical protein